MASALPPSFRSASPVSARRPRHPNRAVVSNDVAPFFLIPEPLFSRPSRSQPSRQRSDVSRLWAGICKALPQTKAPGPERDVELYPAAAAPRDFAAHRRACETIAFLAGRRRLPTNRGYPDAGFPTRAVSRSRSAFAGCVTHRLAPFVTLDFCLAKGPLCYSREGNKPLPGGKTDPKGLKASGLMYTAPMLVPKLKAGSKSSPPDSRIGYGLSRKG